MWEWTAVKGSISKNDTYFGNSVTSSTEAFEHELSFCRMRNFLKMHKELAYNSDIPHSSCLCEASEKASLLAKRINSSLESSNILSPTAHDLVETHTCGSSSKDCLLGNCLECLKPGLSISDFKAYVVLISFLQWQQVEKNIVIVNQTMPFGQVIPKWVETISNLKRHIYRKGEEVASYNKQKDELKLEEALIHVDYSESYNNAQQDEIQSVYFDQLNFSIFTSRSYCHEAEQGDLAKIPIAVISESSDHSQIATFTCTNAIVNELKKRMKDSLKKLILWRDGCSLQIRSKYVFALMTHFDKSVQLEWNYNRTHYRWCWLDK